MNNKIENILATDINFLKLKVSTLSNKDLVDSFKHAFMTINDYKPDNEWDKYQILDYSKCYIDELQNRLTKGSSRVVYDFAKLLQNLMKTDSSSIDNSYYTLNLVRLYSFCVTIMQKRKLPQQQIKKEFL